jgi:transcription initiation factor TFIIH subunit 3
VTIDACQLFGPETVFLQQAAHLTNGSYIYLERRDALLQYLTVISHEPISDGVLNAGITFQMTFLSPIAIRSIIAVPTQEKIDFRAACFCHKNIVDIGFVCSVCLSSTLYFVALRICILKLLQVFCKPVPVCSTCRHVPNMPVFEAER